MNTRGKDNRARRQLSYAFGGVLTIALAIAVIDLSVQPANATHLPADKIQVSASTIQVLSTQPQPVTLLTATLRNSTPTDLIIQVSAECALWTDVASPLGEADASVKVWAEIDGMAVPVTSDPNKGGPDDGKVVFCNRIFRLQTSLLDLFQLFLRTRSANAFDWGTLNVGNGIHTIEVKAQLETTAIGAAFAQAAVGKRTLVVEPAKLANDVTI